MVKKLTAFGALAVCIYISHVLIGGILWEGYSHLRQPISDLTASGAPDRNLLSFFTVMYGLFSIVFSLGAYMYLKRFAPKISQSGMIVLLTMHVISIMYNFFPQDLPGTPVTFRGVMHIVITVLIVPLTILSPILVGIGFRQLKYSRMYAYYSILTGIVIFISGGIMAVLIANDIQLIGLVQRINIGTLQIWMFITAVKLFYTDEIKLVRFPENQ